MESERVQSGATNPQVTEETTEDTRGEMPQDDQHPLPYVPTLTLKNNTLRLIAIGPVAGGEHASLLLVPALDERNVSAEEASRFDYIRWSRRNIITIEALVKPTRQRLTTSYLQTLFTLIYALTLAVSVPIAVVVATALDASSSRWIAIAVLVSIPVAVLLTALGYWRGKGGNQLRFDSHRSIDRRRDRMLAGFQQWLFQVFYLLIVFSVSFGLPGLLFFGFGEGAQLIDFGSPTVGLLGRAFQWVFIAIASSLPGLLYYIFGRREMQALRVNFIRDVMRLDPEIVTQREAEVKYGHLVDQVHGGATVRDLLFGTGLPILMCTLLITLCWTLAFSPFSDVSAVEVDALYQLFLPGRQAFFYGFLGAYFFGANLVFRRYVQSDLTPKAYSHIMLRILVTTILVWAVTLLPVINEVSAILVVVAFIIGIFPETGMALLREYARKTLGNREFFRAL